MKKAETPIQVLKSKFGYKSFRHEQEKIIQHVLAGQDVMVLMPTGGGKSLCYQIPALLMDGLTIVISPLIALMKDQVDALRINGIAAAYLNSSQGQEEQREVFRMMQQGSLKMLYVAPERLAGQEGRFLEFLSKINVSLLAIDEAHCISQWGHDFRPEYMMLGKVKEQLKVPTIALTATADQVTQQDILNKLSLKSPRVFLSSFNRPNIHYYVKPKRGSYHQLLDFLDQHKEESGIIYTLSRNSVESLAERLEAEGFSVKPYHAGLSNAIKEKHQEQFLKDEVKIIVATIAFGMGINKSNVRFVVHMDLPKNIEGYYQETGRAGRDGLQSEALLFYSYADVTKLRGFVEMEDNEAQSRIMLRKLQDMASFGEAKTCRRKFLLEYFGEKAEDYCGSCDVCLTEYEKFDGTVIAQKALSAVVRLEEKFGITYLIDFLRGSSSDKIWDQHKQLKTYGVGEDISKKDWGRYLDYLIQQHYLKKSDGQFPTLELTDQSWEVLKGKTKVELIKTASVKEVEKTTTAQPVEDKLLKELKDLRRDLAQQENVPAYVIFSDATLQELAMYLPLKNTDLVKISGFGEVKIKKYGTPFLKLITDYTKNQGIASRINQVQRRRKQTSTKKSVSDTKKESFNLFRQGKSVDKIAEIRALQTTTIYSHLSFYVEKGDIRAEEIIPARKIPAIEKAVQEHGDVALKPLKEALGDSISYGEIRIGISAYKWKMKERK